ncbi:hypothetical protein IV203_038425 [Nitzschia inconspicua]|uniref:Deltex C-terminal domain-containing protein n=1 Tax=Nitzschia inconspicua TaxID=303405 RepID=A0A9K3LNK5_9STRA|nr:hypothetical protein IV203_038425 [Nitzschia inconspicua]
MTQPFGTNSANQQCMVFGSGRSIPSFGASSETPPQQCSKPPLFGAPQKFPNFGERNNGENIAPKSGAAPRSMQRSPLSKTVSWAKSSSSFVQSARSAFSVPKASQQQLIPVSGFSMDAKNMQNRLFNLKPQKGSFQVTMDEHSFLQCDSKFLHKRQQLKNAGRPYEVKVAFHYTKQCNMVGIKTEGLLLSKARDSSVFGTGIYVANNPYAFRFHGGKGIMVLILAGSQTQTFIRNTERNDNTKFDSFVGNKHCNASTHFFQETILTSSEQVLPLFHFDYEKCWCEERVWDLQKNVQSWANINLPSPAGPLPLEEIQPDEADELYARWLKKDVMPPCFVAKPLIFTWAPTKPQVCLIGFEYYAPKDGQEHAGVSPSGSMTVKESTTHTCVGTNTTNKTLILTYYLQGQQGDGFETYLPDNHEGRKLMERLKKAFAQGLIFKVENGIIMFNITRQKTGLSGGGEAAWPDASFIETTNHKLDQLNVPRN